MTSPADTRSGITRFLKWIALGLALLLLGLTIHVALSSGASGASDQSVSWSGTVIDAISCPTFNSCDAVGSQDHGGTTGRALVFDEDDGVWSSPITIPLSKADDDGFLKSVACSSPGNCIADGVQGANGTILILESNNKWGNSHRLAISSAKSAIGQNFGATGCSPHGTCWAVYLIIKSDQNVDSYAVGESNGAWSTPVRLAANLAPGIRWVTSISCWSVSSCTVLGSAWNDKTRQTTSFTQNEIKGAWGVALPIPDIRLSTNGSGLQCFSAGNCVLGGTQISASGSGEGVLDQEVEGKWRSPQFETGFGSRRAAETVGRIACSSSNQCVASGTVLAKDGRTQVFVQAQLHGIWQKAKILSTIGSYATISASCEQHISCFVVGTVQVTTNRSVPFIEKFVGSKWSDILPRDFRGSAFSHSGFNGVSCTSRGCTSSGFSGASNAIGLVYSFDQN
jgi:hypothetical protein